MLERIALFLMALLIGMLAWQDWAAAQEQKTINVPFTQQERTVLLNLCQAAEWANRIVFTGTCDALKNKFDAAEKKAANDKPEDKPDVEK